MSTKAAILPHLTVQQVSWRKMLLAVPLRNMAASVYREKNGRVILTVPLQRARWQVAPITWIIKLDTERKTRLDEMGTELWELCDGTRTVEEIIEVFSTRYALTFHEARLSVNEQLKQLIQRSALVIEQQID